MTRDARPIHVAAAFACLASAGSLSFGSEAKAEVLVVRALGPSARTYAAGRSLPDSAQLTLAAGDVVTVLGPTGTRTFRGPGRFGVTGATQAGSIASAIQPRSRARIGAVRGTPRTRPDWPINILRGGRVCTSDAWDLSLWRQDTSRPTRVTVSGGGTQASVEWPAGIGQVEWPSAVPVRSGVDYRVAVEGTVPLVLTLVPLEITGDRQSIAAAFIQAGCQAQLDPLVETASAG